MTLPAQIWISALCSLGMMSVAPQALSQSKTQSQPQSKPQYNPLAPGYFKTHKFELEDYDRRYKLYTPQNARNLDGPRPLILVIHGGGGTDRSMIKLDNGKWQSLADQYGFYIAYPNAVDKLWDLGKGVISEGLENRVDDLAYFEYVMDDIASKKNIDTNRIFAQGISRGGQASFLLACNRPERIRAIMAVTMSVRHVMEEDCRSGPPIGIAIMNGTNDPLVPYEGGDITVFRKKRGLVLSTDKTIELWRARNGCRDTAPTTSFIDKPGDKTSVNIFEWTDCSGAPVKLYRVNNGGHTWPSGRQYLPVRRVGETSRDIDASEEGWKFFSQFK